MDKAALMSLLVAFLLVGPTAPVYASGKGYYQHGAAHPFDHNLQGTSLHCLLNKHWQGHFCPHEGFLSSKNHSQGVIIVSHCGGNPHPISATFGLEQELVAMPKVFQVCRSNQLIRLKSSLPAINKFLFLDLGDPPPRFV